MYICKVYVFLLTIQSLWSETRGVKWLALATSSDVGLLQPDSDCNELSGLARKQKKICRKNVEVMLAVKTGAMKSIDECQWQFKHRRWNCSVVDPKTLFGNVLNHGTRETAFVHAISAAGVAYSVTRSCSQGVLEHCGCDHSVNRKKTETLDGFQWSGCSENVAYGTEFSKRFVDARERLKGKHRTRALMNLHNNQAGRMLIASNMQVQCKCHGVSGSCELKTCWRQMPHFRQVGQSLKEKFDGATKVVVKPHSTVPRLTPETSDYKHHTSSDLVYLNDSPNFCDRDKKAGSLGTRGRLCNRTSRAIDGCELLCCGRGFDTRTRVIEERCRCKFQWCCSVKCDTCKKEIEEYYCR